MSSHNACLCNGTEQSNEASDFHKVFKVSFQYLFKCNFEVQDYD